MTVIGAAWIKSSDNGGYFYSITLDKGILPLTLTEDKRLIMRENKNKQNNEKAPDFYLDIFVPDKSKAEKPKEG